MHLPPRPASDTGLRNRTLPPTPPSPPRSCSANSGRLNRTLPPLPSQPRSSSSKSLRLASSQFTPPKMSRSLSAVELPFSKPFLGSSSSPEPVSPCQTSKPFFGESGPGASMEPASLSQIGCSRKGLRDPETIKQALGLASEQGPQDMAAQQAVYERMKAVLSGLQEEYTEKLDALLMQAQVDAQTMLQGNSGEQSTLQDDPLSEFDIHPSAQLTSGQELLAMSPTCQEGLYQSTADLHHAGLEASFDNCERELSAAQENVVLSRLQVDQCASSEHESDDVEFLGMNGSASAMEHVGTSVVETHTSNASSTHEASAVHRAPAASAVQATASKGQKSRKKGSSVKRAKKPKHRDGIVCTKTIQFEGCTAVRCAITVKEEVWTADWSGKVHIRDREDFHKMKDELPFAGLVWCMVAVRARVPMVWVGREQSGICVFDARTKEQLCTLTGGHSGSVIAFATANGPDGRLDIWSASNDFSIRSWHVESGKGKGGAIALPASPPLQIRRGMAYHGHSNSVRCLLHVGPSLWSGSDDKSICLWKCIDGERQEVIEEAHHAGVVCLVIAGRGVWSSGYDGMIREWTIGGKRRSCLREITIGLNEPLRMLLPIGRHVWICGRSKNIAIYSEDMEQIDLLEGHSSFISSLCLVDQVETRIIWSSSLGDHSLKVWQHTLRDAGTSIAELTAANKLYEEESWAVGERMQSAEKAAEVARSEILLASQEFAKELREALCCAAEAEEARAAAEVLQIAATNSEAEVQAKFAAVQQQLEAAEVARLTAEKHAGERLAASEAARADLQQSSHALKAVEEEAASLRAALLLQKSQIADLQTKVEFAESSLENEASGIQDLRQRLETSETEARKVLEAFAKECARSTELESLLQEMHARSSAFEQELNLACEREQQLKLRYAELDIFKLDVIARELKSIDRRIDTLRGETRYFLEAAKKFTNVSDQQSSIRCASCLNEHASGLRGHIRDVIERCLSETQKFHIGAPLQDPTAAGVLQSGGKISGYVVAVPEEALPDLACSAHPRQQDEVRRDRRESA